ncbi:hypothetical protein FGO68_gene3562 [Halteria grandinella]|uniref:1-alkyl-2-acetylglycerophosphocholine esterase n=1 Tax=Halteria grandinella TaxID=5974 RepID=A0A8J8NQ54_HALGN|nr:hypothetical protein FGO68_gene3562 [Halteria grandinella]
MERKYVTTRVLELSQITASLALIYWHIFGMAAFESLGQYAVTYTLILGPLEGVRFPQLPLIFGYIIYRTELLGSCSVYAYLLSVILLVVIRQLYGNVDFSKYPSTPEAPYACGYRTVRSAKYGNEVLVYYPIEKSRANNEKYEDVEFLTYGSKTLRGLAKLSFPLLKSGFLGPLIFRQLLGIKLGVYKNAPVDESFQHKKIIPIFFSHGLASISFFYSRLLRDLAMWGYLVIALNHQDESCIHTVTSTGDDIYINLAGTTVHHIEDRPSRTKQLRQREQELIALIDEFSMKETSEGGILRRLQLPEWLQLDKEKLTVSGHSFGAKTALRAAFLDKRVKAALTIDPWMFVHHQDVLDGVFKVDIPHIAVNSQNYQRVTSFDIYGAINKFFTNSKGTEQEQHLIKGIYHEEQTDMCCLTLFELGIGLGVPFHPRVPQLYYMHGQLWLQFLDKIGFGTGHKAIEHVEKRCADFLRLNNQ